MKVLTQNGTELVSVDNFIINDKAEILGYPTLNSELVFLLGKYKDLDEAKEVLVNMSNYTSLYTYIMPQSKTDTKPISDLKLTVRTDTILRGAGYCTVEDVIKKIDEISQIKNVGRKTLKEIHEAIKPYLKEE